jgi:hypothetical protein
MVEELPADDAPRHRNVGVFKYNYVLNTWCICWLFIVNVCKMRGTYSFKIVEQHI